MSLWILGRFCWGSRSFVQNQCWSLLAPSPDQRFRLPLSVTRQFSRQERTPSITEIGLQGSSRHHIDTLEGGEVPWVAQKSRFDHITPVLSELHWLPVRHRINFKIAAITHTVLRSQQPSYLAALIPRYAPVRSLRSSSSLSICVPLRKTSMEPLVRFRRSHQKFGMHCRVIFRPSQLFLLSEELSNTIFSCLLILTVGHLVASRHPNVSRFVIRHHLLPSC